MIELEYGLKLSVGLKSFVKITKKKGAVVAYSKSIESSKTLNK